MIGIGMPISHNKTPRMGPCLRLRGWYLLATSKAAGSSGADLGGDGGAGRGFQLERGRQQRLGVIGLGL